MIGVLVQRQKNPQTYRHAMRLMNVCKYLAALNRTVRETVDMLSLWQSLCEFRHLFKNTLTNHSNCRVRKIVGMQAFKVSLFFDHPKSKHNGIFGHGIHPRRCTPIVSPIWSWDEFYVSPAFPCIVTRFHCLDQHETRKHKTTDGKLQKIAGNIETMIPQGTHALFGTQLRQSTGWSWS